ITTELKESQIKIGAQAYLEKFYQSLGFKPVSEVYLEDDIPHLDMLYSKPVN
ncbi:GNAT family N-acetyltransferase, partial [Streptococcus suis]|nr:GNAT family N-acetyltransferase [Streptococcus suis]